MMRAVEDRWAARRNDFPALQRLVAGKPVVYLDSAATAQKPHVVIEAMRRLYAQGVGNAHRGVHAWANASTEAYAAAREVVARFLGAARPEEIVFTRGATEALNLAAWCLAERALAARPRVVVSELEHHSNLVPWQQRCRSLGFELAVLPMNDDGDLDLDAVDRVIDERTGVVALCHVSNSLGSVVPIERIIARAKDVGAWCIVDGAQAVPHLPVDVTALGCDAYVFSGHKVYGPDGVGVLWARYDELERARPWLYGGDMVTTVSLADATFAAPPQRFEAGTPNVAGAVGLAAALEYVESLGRASIGAHEVGLVSGLLDRLRGWPGVHVVGSPRRRASVVSLVVDDVHPHDVGTLLDDEGIAVRTGLHCAEPAIRRMGHAATVRVSFGLYNTDADVHRFCEGLRSVQEMFA